MAERNYHNLHSALFGRGSRTGLRRAGKPFRVRGRIDCLIIYSTLPPSTPISQFSEGCFICQPTLFSWRSIWLLLGTLDENLKTAFDFDFWLRAFLVFPDRIGFVDALQACSRLHEECMTLRMRRTVALQRMQVLSRHFNSAPKAWLMTYVNELLAMQPGQRQVGDLSKQLADMLAVAGPWLKQDELRELELNLDELLK